MPERDLCLSFDFNIDPITCIAAQHGTTPSRNTDANTNAPFIHILSEFRLPNSNIYALCAAIQARYPSRGRVWITGDASGNARSALVPDGAGYYRVILQELGLRSSALKVPRHNPLHHDSRMLLNSILARHSRFVIDPSCSHLIEDLNLTATHSNGGIDKSNAQRGHLLDALRYYLHAHHGHFITHPLAAT
jgi:hypothetical protein